MLRIWAAECSPANMIRLGEHWKFADNEALEYWHLILLSMCEYPLSAVDQRI